MRTICTDCNSTRLSVGRTHIASGAEVFPLYCLDCGKTQTQYIKKELALAHEAKHGTLQYVKTKTAINRVTPKCEVCGKEGAELHHWAPRHLFTEADDWPTSYLCREHHAQWHKTVTPNMGKTQCAAPDATAT